MANSAKMVALLLQLVVVGLSLGALQAQTTTFNDTTVTALDSPEDTCTVLQTIALSLEEMVVGSFCQVRDDDQDSCNDCLWLNCTAAPSSVLGTVFVSFRSRFLPCYAYNASEGIDIHASNSSLFAGTDQFLTSVFADRTASVEVTVELGGFPGTYIVQFTLEQLGDGILYGVAVATQSSNNMFVIVDPVYIPLSCTTKTVSECAVQRSVVLFNGLGPGGIAGTVLGTTVSVIIGLVLILTVVFLVLRKKRMKDGFEVSYVYSNPAAKQENEYYSNGLIPYSGSLVDRNLPDVEDVAHLDVSCKADLDDDDNDDGSYEDIVSPYMVFQPKYGVSVPQVDFHSFNVTRKEAGIDEWDYPRERLTYMRELGEGQFGKVILMKAKGIAGYEGNIPVAVKTLSSTDPDDRKKFAEETELMKIFSHHNIVSLLGTCHEEEDGAPMIILELMPYGDLKDFLIKQKENEAMVTSICQFEVYQIASGIASALEFLAENKYVHRDIAARNCLVGEGLSVKLADFGLARAVHNNDCYRLNGPAKLPLRWMAPESIMFGIFTTQTDTWSFGVLLYEIVTFGDIPYEDMGVQEIVSNAKEGTLRLPKPNDCPDKLHEIMRHCQAHNPEDRPSFSAIRHSLCRERVRTRSERLKTIRSNTVGCKKQENAKAAEGVCTGMGQDNGQYLKTEGAVVQQ